MTLLSKAELAEIRDHFEDIYNMFPRDSDGGCAKRLLSHIEALHEREEKMRDMLQIAATCFSIQAIGGSGACKNSAMEINNFLASFPSIV